MRRLDARLLCGLVAAALTGSIVLAGQYRPAEQSVLLGVAVAIVAAVAATTVAYLAVASPWRGLIGWLAAMPIIGLARSELWIGPVQLISSSPLAAALVVGVLFEIPWRRRAAWSGAGPLTWSMLAAIPVLGVASTLIAPTTVESSNVTIHGLLEPIAVVAVVLALRPGPRAALQALVALAAGVTMAAVINLGWMQLTLASDDLYQRRLLFARLTYFNVGIFGEVLVLALPAIGAIVLLRGRTGWPRWVVPAGWAAVGLALVALFYTYTKSAWLSAALVTALMIVALVPGLWRRVGLLLATLVLLAVVVPYPTALLSRISPDLSRSYRDVVVALQSEQRVESWDPETTEGSGSVQIRWIALWASADLVASNPLLGVGPTRFGPEFSLIRPDASVPNLSSAHNLLPNLAAEYGLPLAILFTILVGMAMWGGVEALRDQDQMSRTVRVAVAVALVGFIAMGTLFGNDLYRSYRKVNADMIVAAALLGLGLVLRHTARTAGANGPAAVEPGRSTAAPPPGRGG